MNLAKLPFYKMYPADADTDENFRLMTFEQRGVYWTLLNHAWLNDGLPVSQDDLCAMLHVRLKDFLIIWEKVGLCFPEIDGRRRNPRQEDERIAARTKSEHATESVRTRYERKPNVPTRASESASDSESSERTTVKEKTSTRARNAQDCMFPMYVTNEYGRRDNNPVYDRVMGALRASREKIEKAGDPVAYTKAIIERASHG